MLGALHPSLPLYAVVDCARRRRILPWLLGTRAPAWCLYRARKGEQLPSPLLGVAPQLLRLGRGHAFTEEFFSAGWGDSWGIVFASAAQPLDLRRHLRRFLRVRTGSMPSLEVVRLAEPCPLEKRKPWEVVGLLSTAAEDDEGELAEGAAVAAHAAQGDAVSQWELKGAVVDHEPDDR